MVLKIHNSFSGEKEEFIPLNPQQVTMYNCGPTVYDYFHIGNARNFVVVDIIRRYLKYIGYKVKFIQNITDIDDKIINKANKEGISTKDVAEKYTRIFFEQSSKLNVLQADYHPKATEYIPQMVSLIETLIAKGYAYAIDGDVYYRVAKYEKYGQLSGKNINELMEGARVEVDERKENPLDFALWKSSKPGEPFWESPWGKGRPGWHIECSVMSMSLLGETIDMHSGGVDLLFPHHENERAQSEAATDKRFVRYWIHNGFLNINNEKMSKSLGNFFTINEVLEKYSPLTVRYFLISAHYKHPLNFSEENLKEAQNAVERIRDAVITTYKVLKSSGVSVEGQYAPIQNYIDKFKEAMDDDFNTARALSIIFEVVTEINAQRQQMQQIDAETAKNLLSLTATVNEMCNILGLEIAESEQGNGKGKEEGLIELLLELRRDLRAKKEWQLADKVRNGLKDLSIVIEDHPQGTIWKNM